MKILLLVLLNSFSIYAENCEEYFNNQIKLSIAQGKKNQIQHQKFIDQYENNLEWEVDWDSTFEWRFVDSLSEACSHAQSLKFDYTVFDVYEIIVMYQYTNNLYKYLNKYLRSEHKRLDLQLVVDALDRAIQKFPLYKGVVKRGTYLPTSIDEMYIENAVVLDKAFVSTSKTSATPFTNFHTRSHQMKIFTCSGRDISTFSKSPDEEEVLIPRETRFTIKRRVENDKQVFLSMHELEKDDSFCH